MPSWALTTIKWVVTLAAMGLLVMWAAPLALEAARDSMSVDLGLTFNGDDDVDPDDETPLTEGETIDGEVAAFSDISVTNDIVHHAAGPELLLGPAEDDEVLLGFPFIDVQPAECLLSVQLVANVIEAPGEVEIVVRPASVPGIARMVDEAEVPPDRVGLGAPSASATTSGGEVVWELVSFYARARRLAEEADDGFLVLSVRLASSITEAPADGEDEGEAETEEATEEEGEPSAAPVTLVANEAGVPAEAPRLVWEALEGCITGPDSRPGLDDDDDGGVDDGFDVDPDDDAVDDGADAEEGDGAVDEDAADEDAADA